MFRIKKKHLISGISLLITFGLITSITGCNKNTTDTPVKSVDEMLMTSLLDTNSTTDVLINHDTMTVEKGDFSELLYARGQFDFGTPISVGQPYEHGDVTFIQYNITIIGSNNGTFVEEGTSLATLKFEVDPVAKEEAKISLQKAQNIYRKELADRKEDLELLDARIKTATTFYEQQLLEEEYSETLAEYNDYVETAEAEIAELQASYDIFLQDTVEFEIYAPTSGIIAKSDNLHAGDLIDNDASLFYIYSLDNLKITVRNAKFNYGDKVNVSYQPGSKEYTFTGTVVSANNLFYNNVLSSCTIALDLDTIPDFSMFSLNQFRTGPNVSVTRNIANDVCIIPLLALDSSQGSIGTVTTYSNGTTYKSNIRIAHKSKEYVWVIGGLNEGDQIIN